MEFIDPRSTPFVPPATRGELPHLIKPGGIYFVTFRLADAVTGTRVTPHDSTAAPDCDPAAMLMGFDPPITLGSCVLKQPNVAMLLRDKILEGDGRLYELAAWCVMPNHVHAVVQPFADYSLSRILQGWKGASARQINVLKARFGSANPSTT